METAKGQGQYFVLPLSSIAPKTGAISCPIRAAIKNDADIRKEEMAMIQDNPPDRK